jgi:predicted ribosome quality control (RQC) complex YloA/Tae2 family protein
LVAKDRDLYKACNGNVLDFYIEGNILVVDENRDVIALYEGDKENNRLICNRVLKERE